MYLFALYMNMGDEYLEMYFSASQKESSMDKKSQLKYEK